MLRDLGLERGRRLDAGRLEDLDLDRLGVGVAHPDVDARGEAHRLQEVAVDGGRHHPQIVDVYPGRGDARRERSLDQAARRLGSAARDDPGAALERGTERHPQPHRRLGRQVDVDEAGERQTSARSRSGPRLPDQVPVDDRPRLDLLERIDANARHDDAVRPERAVVADRRPFLDSCVGADVARPADDGAVDDHASVDVALGVDDGARDARVVAQRDAAAEHGIRPDGRARRQAAVVADERRSQNAIQLVDLDALAEPDVAEDAEPGDVERHALVESVEVRLPVLVEVADVLPVALERQSVQWPPHLE